MVDSDTFLSGSLRFCVDGEFLAAYDLNKKIENIVIPRIGEKVDFGSGARVVKDVIYNYALHSVNVEVYL